MAGADRRTTTIIDEAMREALARAKPLILKSGRCRGGPDSAEIIWEQGRRELALHAEGRLVIVCPVSSAGDVRDIGIFNTELDEAKPIMDDDPGRKGRRLRV